MSVTPEIVRQLAAAQGVTLAPSRAATAAGALAMSLSILARYAQELEFEREPAGFLAALAPQEPPA